MSHIKTTVPTIAITPEDGPNIKPDSTLNIEDVATDIEEIYLENEKRRKRTKKHAAKKHTYATDIEDMEGSEDDLITKIIKHKNPIVMDDIFQSEVPDVVEVYKYNQAGGRSKCKLQSQASISKHNNILYVDNVEDKQGLTDNEELSDYEEDKVSQIELSESDLLKEIIHDSGLIAISDSVKKFLQAVPSPVATPVSNVSDSDWIKGESSNSKSLKVKGKYCKHHTSPLSISPHLSDLTDTEVIHYDSNDDISKSKHKYGKTRRHTLPQKITTDTTDSEDIEVSDNDQNKLRRVTVSDLSGSNTGKLRTQFILHTSREESDDVNILQMQEAESDEEVNAVLYSKKKRATRKHTDIFLKVDTGELECITDAEDLENFSPDDKSDIYEENAINYANAIENDIGFIDEKALVKKTEDIYKIEEKRVVIHEDSDKSENNATDEEKCGFESDTEDEKKPSQIDLNINLKFKSKKRLLKKNNQPKQIKINHLMPSEGDECALTDIENLNSSDDEKDPQNEIPITVLNDGYSTNETDSESVEEDVCQLDISEVPANFIPSALRNVINETETNENVSKVVQTTAADDNDDSLSTQISNCKTDIEEFSGSELEDNLIEDKYILDIHLSAEGKIIQKDALKVPAGNASEGEETVIEDIENLQKPTKNKRYQHSLHVTNDNSIKGTDVEDLYLSDADNIKDFNYLDIQVEDASGSKTDVEDFVDSGNEQDRPDIQLSRTPDILQQMEGETICSQEGSGKFSKKERMKFNEKHRHLSLSAVSPSPTLTDEIIASADDENYSRAETATPPQMTQDLDESSESRIFSQTTKKADLRADDEVMYLKGGGFIPDVTTDVEDLGISDEEFFLANDRNEHELSGNSVFVNINNDQYKKELKIVHQAAENDDMSVSWFNGTVAYEDTNTGTATNVINYLLDKQNGSKCRVVKPKLLFTFAINCQNSVYKTTFCISNSIIPSFASTSLLHVELQKIIELTAVEYCSTFNFIPADISNDVLRSQSLNSEKMSQSSFETVSNKYFMKIRSGSVTKLITKYQLPSSPQEITKNTDQVTQNKDKPQLNKITSIQPTDACIEQPKRVNRKSISASTNAVIEKAKHFDMLFMPKEQFSINTKPKIVREKLKQQEWGPAKGESALVEPTAVRDAAQQDAGAVRTKHFTGNHRTFGASCSKPVSSSASFTEPCTHVNCPNSHHLSSYTHLDKILDYMLAEVDEQERLVQLDLPGSQKSLTPVCVNSLNLEPATEAVIEIPVSVPKSPKLYKTRRQITIDDSDSNDQLSTSTFDIDDETSLKTLNKSQDTDSLMSFESISEVYFLENIPNNAYRASSESLSESECNFSVDCIQEEHIYEIIETKDEFLDFSNNKELNINAQQDIWWEGTYRDLSIVPEEDEDDLSEVSGSGQRYKYLSEPKIELKSETILLGPVKTHCDEHIYDTISQHSSSDISVTTGDEYDTSDVERNISCTKPVKAEIKLLVKTSDQGREDVEIRTLREFADKVHEAESSDFSKNSNPKLVQSYLDTARNKTENNKNNEKPTFILQRLFVRCPENDFTKTITNDGIKESPELVATTPTNTQYPLLYQPNQLTRPKNNERVDLYANTPFYPCYESYNAEKVDPSKQTTTFPTAYCDWLLQPDDASGGKTTSPSKLVSNEDKIKLVTGESIINDVLSKDIKPVIDETNAFIRMESQSATADIITPSQDELKSPDLTDKETKDLDNKKEKNKSKGGFFSSLKSLVGRSFDSSDSESREERTPKKKKKDRGHPKKGKKSKESKVDEHEIQKSPKQKRTSPKAAKRAKALYESSDAHIPAIDEIEPINIQVTDLDAEPCNTNDVTQRATDIVDNVINDSQHAASKMLKGKIQEFNLEGTVTPEEVRRSTEPIIINEDEFLVVIEPKRMDVDEAHNIELNVNNLETDMDGKSDTLKSKKSVGFMKLFGKKESKESDDEGREETKAGPTKHDTEKHEEHRKSTGFFGIFSKKPKEEEKKKEEYINIILKEEPGIEYSKEPKEFSIDVQQQMMDTSHFLMREVEFFEDVRPIIMKPIDIIQEKKEQVKAVEHNASKPPEIIYTSYETQQHMVDTTHFLRREIELFDDVRPRTVPTLPKVEKTNEEKIVKEESAPVKSNIIIDPSVQQNMMDTAHFLLKEIELFEDVKIKVETKKETLGTLTEINITHKAAELVDTVKDVKENIAEIPESIAEITISDVKEFQASENVPTSVTSSPEKRHATDSDSDAKPPGFFSLLGFGSKGSEKREEIKEKKRQKKKKDKKPGFFSKFGEKFSSSSQEDKNYLSSDDEIKVGKIEKPKAVPELTNISEKAETLKTDTTAALIAEHRSAGLFSDLDKKVKSTVKEAEDEVSKASETTKKKLEDSAQQIKDTSGVIIEDVKKTSQETKEGISAKSQDIKQDITDASQDILVKTATLIDDAQVKASSIKEDTASVIQKGKAKIETSTDAIQVKLVDAKESVGTMAQNIANSSENYANELKDKLHARVEDDKDIEKETESKVIQGQKYVQDKIVTAQEVVTETVKDGASNIQKSGKEAAEKTGGFFSSLGRKLKGSSKEMQDEIVVKSESGKEKLVATTDAASKRVQESVKDLRETAQSVQEGAVSTTVKISDKIGETVDDTKDNIKDKLDTTKETLSDIQASAKQSATDAKETVLERAELAKENVQVKKTAIESKTKESIENAKDGLNNLTQSVQESVSAAKDFGDEKVKGLITDTKNSAHISIEEVKEATNDATKEISSTESKVKESVKDATKTTGGFLSSLGKKIKESADDAKDNIADKAEETSTALNAAGDNMKENLSHLKEDALEAKEITVAKTQEVASDVKEDIKNAAGKLSTAAENITSSKEKKQKDKSDPPKDKSEKSGGFFSGLGKKFKGSSKDTKDAVIETSSQLKDKIEDSAEDTKQFTKDTVSTVEELASDIKMNLKDIPEETHAKAKDDVTEKSGGFFSGLGKKIKGTTKETKEAASDSASKAKDKLKDVTEATELKLADVGQDFKDNTNATKEAAIKKLTDTKDVIKEISSDIAEDTKDAAKDATETTVEFLSGITRKVEVSAADAKETISESADNAKDKLKETVDTEKENIKDAAKTVATKLDAAKEHGDQKIKDTAEDVQRAADDTKDTIKDAVDKTGGFFSSLGKKIKGSTKDAKDAISESADDAKGKFKETAAKRKETIKDAAETVATKLDDTKEASAKKICETAEQVKDVASEAAEDTKGAVKDAVDKTGGFLSNLGQKIKGSAKDTKDKISETTDDTKTKLKETATKGEQHIKDAAKEVATEAEEAKQIAMQQINEKSEDTGLYLKEKTVDGVDQIKSTGDDVKVLLHGTGKQAHDALSNLGNKMKDSAYQVEETATAKATELKDSLKDTATEAKNTITTAQEDLADKIVTSKNAAAAKIESAVDDTKDAAGDIAVKLSDSSENAAIEIKKKKVEISEKVEDNTQQVQESIKDAAEKTGGFFSGLGKKFKSTTKDTKETVSQSANQLADNIKETTDKSDDKLKEIGKDIKDKTVSIKDAGIVKITESLEDVKAKSKDTAKKAEESLKQTKETAEEKMKDGKEKLKDVVQDTKESVKETTEKTGGFFSSLGRKFKGSAKESKSAISDTADKLKENVTETAEIGVNKISDIGQILNEKSTEITEKMEESGDKIKQIGTDAAKKVDESVSNINENIKDKKDKASEKIEDVKENLNDAGEKTDVFFTELGDKISNTTSDMSNKITTCGDDIGTKFGEALEDIQKKSADAKDVTMEKVKETTDDIKSGAASKIDQIKDSGKDVKDSLKTKEEEAVFSMKNVAQASKETVEDATEKTGGFFSGLGKKIKRSTKDTKDAVSNSAHLLSDEIQETVKKGDAKVKEKGQDLKERKDECVEDIQKSVKDFEIGIKTKGENAKEKIVEVKDKSADKINDMSSNVKESVDTAVEKTGGFFSGLGKKLKGTATDTKETISSTTEQAKENVIEGHEKLNEVGQKLTESVHANVVIVKDSAKEATDILKGKQDEIFEKLEDSRSNATKSAKSFVAEAGDQFGEMKEKTAHLAFESVDGLGMQTKNKLHEMKHGLDETAANMRIAGSKKIDASKDAVKTIAEDANEARIDAETKTKEKFKDITATSEDTVIDAMEKTGGFFSGIGKMFKGTAQETKDLVSDSTYKLDENIKETADKAQKKTTEVGQSINDNLASVKDSGVRKIEETADRIGSGATKTKDKLTDSFKETTLGAKEKLTHAANESNKFLIDLGEKVQESAIESKTALSDSAIKLSDKVSESIEGAKTSAKGAAGNLQEKATVAKDTIAEKSVDTIDVIKDTNKNVTEKTKGFFSELEGKIVDSLDNANDTGATKISEAKERIKESKGMVDSKVENIKHGVSEAVDSANDWIAPKLQQSEKIFDSGAQTARVQVNEISKDMLENINIKTNQGIEKMKDTKDATEKVAQNVAQETGSFFSNLGSKINKSTQDAKDSISHASDETENRLKESTIMADTKLKKFDEGLKDSKEHVIAQIQQTTDAAKATAKEVSNKASKSVKDTAENFNEKVGVKIGHLKDQADVAKEIVKEKTASVKESIDEKVATGFKNMNDGSKIIQETMKQGTQKVDDTISDLGKQVTESTSSKKEDITEFVTKAAASIGDDVQDLKENVSDKIQRSKTSLDNTVASKSESTENALKDTTQQIKNKLGEIRTDSKEKLVDSAAKVEIAGEQIMAKASSMVDEIPGKSKKTRKRNKKNKAAKDTDKEGEFLGQSPTDETSPETSPEHSELLLEPTNGKSSDFICFVTTPTMQRKGIGGSQRLSKDDRPPLIDVSNMPHESSSDEDEYIVTEPGERLLDDRGSSRGSSIIIETIQESDETEQDPPYQTNFLTDLDGKKRPIFRIGSRDEESFSESTDLGGKLAKEVFDFEITKKDIPQSFDNEAKTNIDLIEDKLVEIGKALDDLEKVSVELEPQESIEDDKHERKLKRVERRFERMASETMEKDSIEAKENQMTSPEVEAKREDDFRKIVSQLSQEDVSECQRLYSTLWDDATFTPSEEWDSKTPDSQPDDIQELPQGEVVYMGPVTLNKDHLINTAGIEVNVIPIKRSPCTSPLPKRKLETKGRAKSAMGFYKEKQIEERGSLPDLQNTGKINEPKLDIQRGSIMSAIRRSNPNILEESKIVSKSSQTKFNLFDIERTFSRRMSTESLTRGTVVTAVKDWMARSTPFGSTDNIRSTDAISLADTTISIYDDDDNDSVDLQSDSIYQFESESSKSDNNVVPDIYVYDNSFPNVMVDSLQFANRTKAQSNGSGAATTLTQRVLSTIDQFGLGETSGGPLTKLTSEGSSHLTTNLDQLAELTPVPKPKPRVDRTPDSNKQITTETEPSKEPATDSTDTTESYFDRKKFWETVSSSKSEEERHEVSVRKRMSLFEENLFKHDQEKVIAKKRTSVHEIATVPPVPKPRSTVLQTSSEESSSLDSQLQDIVEVKEVAPEKPEGFVSEYKSAFKDPTLKTEQPKVEQETTLVDIMEPKKSQSLDSENEYLKYEHQAYENPGYISESDHEDVITNELSENVPKVKRRQMSISQPPVAAARKTIFERSLSLPTDNLQDINETSVKARKQFFEQQIKNDMVIDQLMTQFEEEEPQEYKTLSVVSESKNIVPAEASAKESAKYSEKEVKEIEKKLSPTISSSSTQDTRTEDDITQYTPTSVKDLTRYFQPNLISDTISTNIHRETKMTTNDFAFTQELEQRLPFDTSKKQPSIESEQSISSERSIELGSIDDLPSQVAEMLQYKSDSISKPGDSQEVHVDKSEIEDSEKVIDIEQESTDIKIKSLSELSMVSPIREHQEYIVDTTWEVIESQPVTEIVESVTEISVERQVTAEKDDELSGSVRDESDLGSEIHQDHSESYESERVRSDHSEVEQLILESLYHQKINPEDARKMASELIDDIEAEIERRNLSPGDEYEDSDPPAPPAEVAKNQISDYLRQLAVAKGLDAKEVELVETVLARKQNELSKLGRNDTQTSSMEITDEDLKYSGEECDISPSESTENILEEQIEKLEFERKASELKEKSSIDEEMFSEKSSDTKSRDIHEHHDRIFYEDESLVSVKADTSGKVETTTGEQRDVFKKMEQVIEDNILTAKTLEQKKELTDSVEKTTLQTQIEVTTDSKHHVESADTTITDSRKDERIEKSSSTKQVTDTGEIEQKTVEERDKKNIVLEGKLESVSSMHEEIDSGYRDTQSYGATKARGSLQEENENKIEHKQEKVIAEDGSTIISEQRKESVRTKTVTTSEIVDHKREEKTSIQTFVQEIIEEPMAISDDSKSSTYESAKSPEEQFSTSSSLRKDETETSNILEKPEVILRRTRIQRDGDTSSSSGNLRTDNRKSGADFEAYSSSGESHYHSFEQDSGRSRPCSSDVEGLMAAGSSEYESALTSQDISSRSHVTSTEYHTAVSSISSQSMKSLDSESSGNMASVEVSEASETLVASEVPSNFELEGDILDGAMSQLLEDEAADLGQVIEPYDREIPEHVIRGDYQVDDKKSSFDTISDSEIHGESMDISDEDDKNLPEVTGRMKRSQEMTFQPIPKAIPDSPQSDNLEMDERFGTSLEDGSVLSMSLSSQSDATALRTVIEQSRRDSDRMDGSITISGHDSFSASNMSLDKIAPITTSAVDCATSTGFHPQESSLNAVTLTTSVVDENGTQSVSTQVTSGSTTTDDAVNGPTQIDYVPEYDDIVEPKKVRGHRRTESTSTFNASMIPGFTPRTDVFKNLDFKSTDSEKTTATEMTLKEVHHEEMKDVDEMEESYETEADQGYHRQQKESGILDTESDQDADRDENDSRPPSRISKTDSDDQRGMSIGVSEDRPESELIAIMQQVSVDVFSEPIERPLTPEPPIDYEVRGSIDSIQSLPSLPTTPKSKICISEKSSIEEGEAEAAFSMVAHVSPAHKAKGDICPIMEDEDAEKHELETRERTQKELEKRRAQILRDQSPGNIPDIMVTEHMTPLVDREFHYPDLEIEEKEALEEKETLAQKSAPQTPASISSKSSEETDQGREYILDESHKVIPEESESEAATEDKQTKSEISQSTTVEEKTVYEPGIQEPISPADSPNSDSFEMLEKPDIIDDFVVIEEVAKEAAEHDTEGQSVCIQQTKYIRKHDEEVEEYLVRSAPTPLTRMTDLKYYPDGGASSGDEVGPFDFEDSPPQAGKKSTGTKTTKPDDAASQSYAFEYDKELEASKKWIEMQFQGDQAAMISAGYGYEMEFERGPLEDIKEEEATDFESSRIGSLDSQKQSIGSLGSVKDSFSSTPEYDVLAGRKFFTRSGEHDDVSMSSLQEFEHLERVISLENRRHHQGSQDSSSNGSFSKRYHASRSGQGDDVSLSSLKEFEGLESACIEAHQIELKASEEEASLAQIDEAQESLISESESCKSLSSTDKKNLPESEEEDYEKRMFEIDEIIKQAQSNVEKFIDIKDVVDKTESMGRGDSLEEVARVPDLELDEPLVKPTVSTVHTVRWGTEDVMQTSTDSLEQKPEHRASIDSLDMKTTPPDIMTTSTDSIEFQMKSKSGRENIMTDSIEIQDGDKSYMITSDSLELTPGVLTQLGQMSDSIDEDGSRIGAIGHDQSSSSGFSMGRDDEMHDHRADYLLGSTDSLDPSSSTATHATYQYETDSVMSGSFTSGGSNTMVSSTDTIDNQAHGVDLAAAVRKVWFDEDAFGAGSHFTTELLDDGSKPFVTEVIEPCEDDPEYSHTIHRKVQLPPEIKKITFKGQDADLQLRQYIENFGEGEDVQETQETDKDGNIHVKRVVQKRFVVKSGPNGEDQRISGPELESYLQKVSHSKDECDFSYNDPTDFGLTKQIRTDSDGTKTIYGQTFTTKYSEGQGEDSSLKQLLTSIASDVTQSSTFSHQTITRHVDKQQEQPTGSSSTTFSGAAAANVLRAQGSRRKPLRYDISVDDQTEVDPREHDWRFNLPRHDEASANDNVESSGSSQATPQHRADQQQLSSEMKELLEEMEKQTKH